MSKRRWHRPRDLAPQGRDATLVRIIEVVEHTAPETKAQLADDLGISEQYLSELLQELKRDGVVKKAYVVDDDAAYARAASISPLLEGTDRDARDTEGPRAASTDDAGESMADDAADDANGADDRAVDDADSVGESVADDAADDADDRVAGDVDDRLADDANDRTADPMGGESTADDTTAASAGIAGGDPSVIEPLHRLHEVTAAQYAAAHEAFRGCDPERPAPALESLTNRRYATVLSELKSYTLTTDWPGNRVASDLATITTNLEIVGDRACFIADAVDGHGDDTSGVIAERVADVFAAGEAICDLFERILFSGDATAYADLLAAEEDVHRDLGELFELVTTYEPEAYGYLASVTRALERAIYYWVHAAEVAVRLHTGCRPEHVML